MGKQNSKTKDVSIVRSSASEYLTFIAATGNSQSSVEMRYADENIWLTQKMMATLYDVTISAINQHLKRIYDDNELERGATIKKYLIVQTEGKREVTREVDHYSLQAIIAKKYLSEFEIAPLQRIVSAYLEIAELQVSNIRACFFWFFGRIYTQQYLPRLFRQRTREVAFFPDRSIQASCL